MLWFLCVINDGTFVIDLMLFPLIITFVMNRMFSYVMYVLILLYRSYL